MTPRLEKKWHELPVTGLKVGIANGPLLVKRVGIPRSSYQEPVWAGKAVNYAAKAAQQADQHQMIVTGAVWDWISDNDYLAVSCSCGDGPSPTIWQDVTIEKIPDSDGDQQGKLLRSFWCDIHGPEFCTAVLEGKKRRSDVTTERTSALKAEMAKAIRARAYKLRRDREARRAGLR